MNMVATIIRHRELLWNLAARDLKSRYKGSVMGFLWTMITPLFMAVIYIFFLRLLAGRGFPMQYEDVLIGVFAWQYTVQCVTGGMESIAGNANLVKKVFFPRILLPLSVVVSALINYLFTLVIQLVLVAGLLAWRGLGLSPLVAALPLLVLYHTLFNLGLSLLLGAAQVVFRDTRHLVGLFISAWFFMSPVMYPLSLVDQLAANLPWVRDLFMLNPLSVIITGYRVLQVPGATFPWSAAAWVGWAWPLVLLLAAYAGFQRAQRNFADYL